VIVSESDSNLPGMAADEHTAQANAAVKVPADNVGPMAVDAGAIADEPDINELVPSRIKSTNPHHQPRNLTVGQRAKFRQIAIGSRQAKLAAMS